MLKRHGKGYRWELSYSGKKEMFICWRLAFLFTLRWCCISYLLSIVRVLSSQEKEGLNNLHNGRLLTNASRRYVQKREIISLKWERETTQHFNKLGDNPTGWRLTKGCNNQDIGWSNREANGSYNHIEWSDISLFSLNIVVIYTYKTWILSVCMFVRVFQIHQKSQGHEIHSV